MCVFFTPSSRSGTRRKHPGVAMENFRSSSGWNGKWPLKIAPHTHTDTGQKGYFHAQVPSITLWGGGGMSVENETLCRLAKLGEMARHTRTRSD